MVVTVNRNAAFREVEKRRGTSEIMTRPLLQIIDEMEARTREALELAKKIEQFFGSDSNTTRETEESADSQS